MLKKELIELLKDVEDGQEVNDILSNSELINLDTFKKLVDSNKDFKSYMDSEKDKHYSKAFDTWKQNNLQKLIDDEVSKLNVGGTKSPEQIELEKLKNQLDKMNSENLRKQLVNTALKVATEKKLPTDLIEYFIGEDEATTLSNIEKFEKTYTKSLENDVKETMKTSTHKPESSVGESSGSSFNLMELVSENQVTRD